MRKVYGRGLNIAGQIDNTYQNYKKFIHLQELDNHPIQNLNCGYLQTYFFLSSGVLIHRGHLLDTLSSIRILNMHKFSPFLYKTMVRFALQWQQQYKFKNMSYLDTKCLIVNPKQAFQQGLKLSNPVFGLSGIHFFDQYKNMYVIGENFFGQRALNNQLAVTNVRKVEYLKSNHAAKMSKNIKNLKIGEQIQEQKPQLGYKIDNVALGLQHTLIITEKGQLYGCGKADSYQIQPYQYHYYRDTMLRPEIIDPELIWNKRRVVMAACGSKHSIFLTQDNKLYALGSNIYGQCGLDSKKYENAMRATQIDFPFLEGQKILDIKCGAFHTLILTTHYCYFMGSNSSKNKNPFMQFTQNVSYPTILNLPSKPIKIFASLDRNAVIAQDGNAYIFGGIDLSKKGGQSGKLQVITDYKFNKDSLIGLGFSHTIIAP